MTALAQDVGQTQLDCRGASDLLRIERFPLRDLDSYLASVDGTADTMAGRRALKTFWLESNKNDEDTADYAVMLAAARSWHDANLRPDEPLMALQDAACLTHANRLASMSLDPGFQRRRIWALTEAW